MMPFNSIPVDFMHLLFLNLAQKLYKLLSGTCNRLGKLERWSLSIDTWKRIGKDLCNSRNYIPSTWGRPPSDIFTYSSGYKAEEWKSFLLVYLIPSLYGKLPMETLLPLAKFIRSLQYLCYHEGMYEEDLAMVENSLSDFLVF